MVVLSKKEPVFIFIGDIIIFAISLWLSLAIRNGHIPAGSDFHDHLLPFGILFVLWVLVFFIAGLYDKYKTILKDKLPGTIFNAQLANSAIAIAFFYLIPSFGIAPKTILFIYLVISFILIYFWRIYSHYLFGFKRKTPAIIVGSGNEMRELEREVNENSRSDLKFISSIDLDKVEGIDFMDEIVNRVYSENVSVIAIDLKNEKVAPILPHLYNLIFSNVRFIDMYKIYEDVFDREPLSLVRYNWFIENISLVPKVSYDLLKRSSDIVLAIIGLIPTVILSPFIAIAIMIETKNTKVIISQKRVGKRGREIKVYKFMTWLFDDAGDAELQKENYITKVGQFLRKSRLDELPQFWNLLKGDLSLIGPRPEMPSYVDVYEKEIPYYNIRHLIKPGLTGWAQIWQENPPKYGVNFDDTKVKLSYDLYYVKNRSLMLDIKIALRTIKTLLSRVGK